MRNKRDIFKMNKENFPSSTINFLRNEYVEVKATPLTAKELRHQLDHNQAILEIASSLRYVNFDNIKGYNASNQMWDRLNTIYGGDDNVLRDKEFFLRGRFDDMEMMKGENIVQYCTRIKEVFNSNQREKWNN